MSSVLQFKATLDQILGSINELKRGSVSAQYGTVLGVSPLQVSLDDDPATPLNGVPVSLVSGLTVGDRVWTVSFRSRTIVVGRVGGTASPRLWVVKKSAWSYSAPTAQTAIPINGAVSADIYASPGWSNDSNGMTVPLSGWYQLNASVSYGSNGTGRRGCGVLVNGESVGGALLPTNSSGTTTISAPTTQALLAKGDRLQPYSQQESGSSLALSNFTLAANYIGPA